MEEDKNLEQKSDKSNEKLHISGVMNSILNDLKSEIDTAKKYENECRSKGYFEGVISNQASIRGFESAIRIVKKYYS
jgi:uncharacterized protein with von Willebrand factor type A (vWA) domain